MTSPADIVNQAIQLIGGFNDQGPVTGTPPAFDGSKLGQAAGVVYNEVVYAVGREFGYDFSRNTATLAATLNTPRPGFKYEYAYPSNGIQVRQILPPAGQDPNNPLPINWLVGNNGPSPSALQKVIWCNLAGAEAEISNTPSENLWDPLFQESVVRELAAKLAIAGVGKPDLMRDLQESGDATQNAAQSRDS